MPPTSLLAASTLSFEPGTIVSISAILITILLFLLSGMATLALWVFRSHATSSGEANKEMKDRITAVETETKQLLAAHTGLDTRVEKLDSRLERIEARIENKVERIENKVERAQQQANEN